MIDRAAQPLYLCDILSVPRSTIGSTQIILCTAHGLRQDVYPAVWSHIHWVRTPFGWVLPDPAAACGAGKVWGNMVNTTCKGAGRCGRLFLTYTLAPTGWVGIPPKADPPVVGGIG